VAAILEAGGDALMRAGLQRDSGWKRALFFAFAALVLFAYGWTVNVPPWDFGKLIGIYIVFFFLVAQLISWLVFKQTPSITLVIGGLLIVAGGVVISMERM
jgi:drug/metabolite transporter superfamily protein YnfA